MCLRINSEYPRQPDGSIRFKLMLLALGGDKKPLLPLRVHSTNFGDSLSGIGEIRDAGQQGEYTSDERHGIHVCPDDASFDAINKGYQYGWVGKAKVKVECTGFLAGGVYSGDSDLPIANETWQSVKILEITPTPEMDDPDFLR